MTDARADFEANTHEAVHQVLLPEMLAVQARKPCSEADINRVTMTWAPHWHRKGTTAFFCPHEGPASSVNEEAMP